MLAALVAVAAYVAPQAAPRSAVYRAASPVMQKRINYEFIEGAGDFKGSVKNPKKPIKLLSRVEELGVLSSLESAGTFSKLERAGAFSRIEKLLPLADDPKILGTVKVVTAALAGVGSVTLVAISAIS